MPPVSLLAVVVQYHWIIPHIVPSLHDLLRPLEGLGYAFWSGIGSDFGQVTLITAVIASTLTFWRHHECNQEGCHRLGRFKHGHLQLCHRHHPLVPDDGKINQTHIDRVSDGKTKQRERGSDRS